MRVIRVLIYEGDEKWIKKTLEHSLQGVHRFATNCSITATVVGVQKTQPDPPWQPWLGAAKADVFLVDQEEKGGDA